MKYLSLLLTVLLLGLLGCSDTSLVGVELEAQQASDAVSLAKKGVKYVPYTSRSSDEDTTLDDTPEADLDIDCDPGTEVEFYKTTLGIANRLGNYTGVGNGCFNYTGLPTTGWARGKRIAVAANGDLFFSTFDVTLDYTTGTQGGEVIVTGGTGRFVNVTSPEPMTGEGPIGGVFTVTGRISSVGSSK